jgi:hypothetical protein
MGNRVTAITFRLFFAVLSLVAVATQLFGVSVPKHFGIVNFFSYFTNLSNILISIVFIVSAIRLITRHTPTTADVAVRGGAVVYILFVGLVFNTLLRDVDLGALIPWVNIVVHFITPLAGLVDWLAWPPRRPLPFRVTFLWMIFPAVYVVYSLIRGAITGFYPYPFFNPAHSGGYGGVALYCLVMLVAFFILAVLIRLVGNAQKRSKIA